MCENKAMKFFISAIFIFLCLGFSVAMLSLWWKLYKGMNARKAQTLEILNKKLELSVRDSGIKGSILNKKLLVLLFYALFIVLVVFGGGALINKLLGA